MYVCMYVCMYQTPPPQQQQQQTRRKKNQVLNVDAMYVCTVCTVYECMYVRMNESISSMIGAGIYHHFRGHSYIHVPRANRRQGV